MPPVPPIPTPIRHHHSDFLEEVAPNAVGCKKTIRKKKRTKKPLKRTYGGSSTVIQQDITELGSEGEEEDQQSEEYEHTTSSHVMKISKELYEKEGINLNIIELDAVPTETLIDEDCPVEDQTTTPTTPTECVGCSWFFMDSSNQLNDIKTNGIEPINKMISSLVTRIHINDLSRLVHAYYMKYIYWPLYHSGVKDVPIWRSEHIKEHILGHTNNPRVISDYMSKVVVGNINALQYCKWKKNKNDAKDIKPDYDALKEEREQMKMYFQLKERTPKICNNTSGSMDQYVGKIIEDLGMGINKFH